MASTALPLNVTSGSTAKVVDQENAGTNKTSVAESNPNGLADNIHSPHELTAFVCLSDFKSNVTRLNIPPLSGGNASRAAQYQI